MTVGVVGAFGLTFICGEITVLGGTTIGIGNAFLTATPHRVTNWLRRSAVGIGDAFNTLTSLLITNRVSQGATVGATERFVGVGVVIIVVVVGGGGASASAGGFLGATNTEGQCRDYQNQKVNMG